MATSAETVRLGQRDLATWEDLVRAQYQRIYNLHLRLSPNAEVAADLTQDTFEQAWKSAASYQGRSRPEVWLYGVALNINRNWWSRQHHREEPVDEMALEDLPDPEPTAEELAILHGRSDLVCAAVRRLPEAYRQVVALRYFLGVSAVEIAQSEGVEAGTIRWRLHEGLRRLWILLQPTLGKESAGDAPGSNGTLRFAS